MFDLIFVVEMLEREKREGEMNVASNFNGQIFVCLQTILLIFRHDETLLHAAAMTRPHRPYMKRGLWGCAALAAVFVIVGRGSSRPCVSLSCCNGLPRSTFRAVTVLHAPCNTLSFTLANFAGNLGTDWPIAVLHNDALTEFVSNTKLVNRLVHDGRLHTMSLERNGFNTLSSSSTDDYSRLLTSPAFWRFLNADHVLIFQTDSVLCSLSPWSVHDFLQYDYVGAPWQVSYEGVNIGNGGLSLRKVDTMLHITRTFACNDSEHEDLYFSRALKQMQDAGQRVALPSVAVASNFAYETGLPPLLTSFGVHKLDTVAWRQLTPVWRKETGDVRSTTFAKPVSMHAQAVAATCPEIIAGVMKSCRVQTYGERDATGVFMAASVVGTQ